MKKYYSNFWLCSCCVFLLTFAFAILGCSSDNNIVSEGSTNEWMAEIPMEVDSAALIKKSEMPVWLSNLVDLWESQGTHKTICQGKTETETVYYIPCYECADYYNSFYHEDGTIFDCRKDTTIPKVSEWTMIYETNYAYGK